MATSIARRWFDEIVPLLQKTAASPELIDAGSGKFSALLQIAKTSPAKKTYLDLLGPIIDFYKKSLIHQIEIAPEQTSGVLSVAPYLEGLTQDEGEYLAEAQRCWSVEGIRACIILGWCATVARMHAKIGALGFDTFNKATADMAAKQFGRFKPFNKKFVVESASELRRTVFDTDLLWVLEFIQLIDSNQHERLRHCFELRNNSAHPGQAPITGENLYSFYSDITKIVLRNPKFALTIEEQR